ncbi:transposase, partial [Tamlana crocina]
MGWSIYITTLPKNKAEANTIFSLYKLRWRIEIIFKSWKSNMGFDKVHNVSQNQLYVIIMARFIMVIICTQFIFKPCRNIIKSTLNKDLSLMKTTHYLIRYPIKLVQIIADLSDFPGKASETIKIMVRYCSYD